MTRRTGFSRLTKGLFIGCVLGAAAAVLYTSRSVAGIRSDISGNNVRFQVRRRPTIAARVEMNYERGKRLRPTIGWLAVFVLSSAVAMISDLRLKKL